MVLRYCLGMMASVSTLIDRRGAATPSRTVNFSIGHLPMSPDRAQRTPNTWYRFAIENVPKTDGLGGVVMNVESGSVKAVPRGKGRECRRAGSRSAAPAQTYPLGG